MRSNSAFEPHLVVHGVCLPTGAEWATRLRGWCFLQIKSGISYWQQPNKSQEILPGESLVLSAETRGALRASQLNEVEFNYFCMEPEKLAGLLSLTEQDSLREAASRDNFSLRVLPATHPISQRFKTLSHRVHGAPLAHRLQLLQLSIDFFDSEMEKKPAAPQDTLEGRGRLRMIMNQMAASDFLESSLSDLAPKVSCSTRHLSRLFREETGVSFREKQTELRLVKACELLATSNAKIVDVALISGFHSNSLFNFVFKRRFGISPGEWRQQNGKKSATRPKFLRMQAV